MRKETIRLDCMLNLLTLKWAGQKFIAMLENTQFLVLTGKKETLMIETNQQMPESVLTAA